MSTFFQMQPKGWKRTPLKFLIEGSQNGVWGGEAGTDEVDAICVRVADFDWHRLSLDLSDPTVRSFARGQVKRLELRPGDIVLEKSGGGEKTSVGRVVMFGGSETAVTSNFVARVRPGRGADPRFLLYLVAAQYLSGFSIQFVKQSTGIQNLDDAALFRSDVWVPDPPAQRRIADFLDRETARIDMLIEKKQRLLGSLAQKTAEEEDGLIFGRPARNLAAPALAPDRKLWKLKSLCSHLGNGFVGPTRDILVNTDQQGAIPYLQSTHIKRRQIDFDRRPYFVLRSWLREKPKAQVRKDDLLIVQTGDCGATAIVDEEFDGAGCHAMIITRPIKERVAPRLLLHVLSSRYGRAQMEAIQTGALHPHLEVGFVKELAIPLPERSRQDDLLEQIENLHASLGRVGKLTSKSIDRLREYRSALITAAVTGQVDSATWWRSGEGERRLDAIQETMPA